MKKLVTKWFSKWYKNENIAESELLMAISDLEKQLSTSSLGNNLYKVRVKQEGRGKSSGYRTRIVYRKNDRAIFLYGFPKNDRENIDSKEEKFWKKTAK